MKVKLIKKAAITTFFTVLTSVGIFAVSSAAPAHAVTIRVLGYSRLNYGGDGSTTSEVQGCYTSSLIGAPMVQGKAWFGSVSSYGPVTVPSSYVPGLIKAHARGHWSDRGYTCLVAS